MGEDTGAAAGPRTQKLQLGPFDVCIDTKPLSTDKSFSKETWLAVHRRVSGS